MGIPPILVCATVPCKFAIPTERRKDSESPSSENTPPNHQIPTRLVPTRKAFANAVWDATPGFAVFVRISVVGATPA